MRNDFMKFLIFIIMLSLLSSCATYSEFQNKKPTFEAISQKPVETIASCSFLKILDVRGTVKLISDGKTKVIAQIGPDNNTYFTVTVKPHNKGSKVSLRQSPNMWGSRAVKEWRLVKSCL